MHCKTFSSSSLFRGSELVDDDFGVIKAPQWRNVMEISTQHERSCMQNSLAVTEKQTENPIKFVAKNILAWFVVENSSEKLLKMIDFRDILQFEMGN